ncbi:MAG TPA: N-acetylmuramoyl-L-alanine amidase [Sphingomonadaceae bacterium]|nr:N-acetylmuramoyl-L-alanine amidase [Sphingomonadaceae bacterium]
MFGSRFRKRRPRYAWGLIAALLALLAPGLVQAATVRGVDIDEGRIVVHFDDSVQRASAFMLDAPNRIAVDIAGAGVGRLEAAGGVVARLRVGLRDGGTARLVFDLAEPALLTGGRFAADGRSLVLSIRGVDQKVFARAANGARRIFSHSDSARVPPPSAGDRSTVRIPLDPSKVTTTLPTPPVSGARGSNRPLVVIDPGHGGHDPGAIAADGRMEKDAALAIAKAIRDELVASGRVRVAMTRSDDRFLVLAERREIARRLGADLFISIHVDSAPNSGARGATIYTLSEVASDRVASQLAARENQADILNGVNLGDASSDVSSILIDLAQRETMNISADFATILQRELSGKIDFRTNFHRFAGLVVLKAPDVPSILFETGYISNPEDLDLLFSRKYQRTIAQGVRNAVETHFARRLANR